jgi:hypothetical protein
MPSPVSTTPWRPGADLGRPHRQVAAPPSSHNGLSIARDLRTYGLGFWATFNARENDLLWHYTAVEGAIA